MSFTIDQIVERYVSLRDAIKTVADRHAEELAPLAKKKEILEQAMLSMLNQSNIESARTDHGTVFKSTVMGVGIDPDGGWEKLTAYMGEEAIERIADSLEKDEPPEAQIAAFSAALSLLNRSVNKTAVKEIMEQKDGFVPPGVKTTLITSVNVRRA